MVFINTLYILYLSSLLCKFIKFCCTFAPCISKKKTYLNIMFIFQLQKAEYELSHIVLLVRSINTNDVKRHVQEKYLLIIWQMTRGGITTFTPLRTTRGALLIVARIERQAICISIYDPCGTQITNEMLHTLIHYASCWLADHHQCLLNGSNKAH